MLGPDREINPDMQSLVTAVSSAWVNFARSGNPGWPSYTVPHRSTMVFGVPSRVVDDPRAVERRLFEAGPPITWTG
jgi:para-nitrobenzyl esterase